jgi:hypothetical protein
MENGLVVMGDLPRKYDGLIVMGDLHRWNDGKNVKWSHCNGWPTQVKKMMVSLW